MRDVEIAMDDLIRLRGGKEFLHPRLHRVIAQKLVIGLRRLCRVNRPPQAGRAIGRDLEAIAPLVGIGEIAARAITARCAEIEGRRQDDEPLGPGEAFEGDAALLAHDAAPAIGADQIGALVPALALWAAHGDRDAAGALLDGDDLVPEEDFDIGQFAHAPEDELCRLELLALDDERKARVVLQQRVVEFRDLAPAWPVPELKDRRDQAEPRHVLDQPSLGQDLERAGMRRRRARIVLRALILVEELHRQAFAPEQERAEQADRAAAGDQNRLSITAHCGVPAAARDPSLLALVVIVNFVEQAAAFRLERAVIGTRRAAGIGGRLEGLAAPALCVIADGEIALEQEHLFPVIMDERRGGEGARLEPQEPRAAAHLAALVEIARQDFLHDGRRIARKRVPAGAQIEAAEFEMRFVHRHGRSCRSCLASLAPPRALCRAARYEYDPWWRAGGTPFRGNARGREDDRDIATGGAAGASADRYGPRPF